MAAGDPTMNRRGPVMKRCGLLRVIGAAALAAGLLWAVPPPALSAQQQPFDRGRIDRFPDHRFPRHPSAKGHHPLGHRHFHHGRRHGGFRHHPRDVHRDRHGFRHHGFRHHGFRHHHFRQHGGHRIVIIVGHDPGHFLFHSGFGRPFGVVPWVVGDPFLAGGSGLGGTVPVVVSERAAGSAAPRLASGEEEGAETDSTPSPPGVTAIRGVHAVNLPEPAEAPAEAAGPCVEVTVHMPAGASTRLRVPLSTLGAAETEEARRVLAARLARGGIFSLEGVAGTGLTVPASMVREVGVEPCPAQAAAPAAAR